MGCSPFWSQQGRDCGRIRRPSRGSINTDSLCTTLVDFSEAQSEVRRVNSAPRANACHVPVPVAH